MTETVLVKAENISKKFCRDLHKSLWYGVQDISSELMGRKYEHELRPKEFWSLNDISFELKRGECLGLIGPNGAGKSTLLKVLNGLIKPDKGRVEIIGRVGALIELGAGFNPILTGRENIYANASILGFSKKEIDEKFDSIIEFSELEEFIDTPVINYSSGMKVRLGFAVAAQMQPDVLIIDEVLAVGDIGFRAKCFNSIYQMMKSAAVILVSHQMPQISRVCSDIMVMNHGESIFKGKDTAKAIDIFYSFFSSEKVIVTGSNRAKVTEVILTTDQEQDVDVINYSDTLIIDLEVATDPRIKKPCVSVDIINQELQLVAQCVSNFDNFEIDNHSGSLKLSLELGEIFLNPGKYSITVSVTSEKLGEILVKSHNIKEFRVKGDFYGYAPFIIKGNWKQINKVI